MQFLVICRECGTPTPVVSSRQAGSWIPNDCRACGSDNVVALRDLTKGELEEIESAIERRRAS